MNQRVSKPQREKPPTVLYRYRPPDEVLLGRLEDLLTNNRIWASSPINFTDPFDCRAPFSFESSDQDWQRYLTKGMRQTTNLPRPQRRRAVRSTMKARSWENPVTQKEILDGFEEGLKNSSVLCLCESGTDLLMWAHYAKGHQGICLRFDTASSPFSMAFRVNYSIAYPKVSLMADPGDQIQASVLTKASCWEYEREWRVVGYQKREGHWEIEDPEALKAVILGMNVEPHVADKVRRLCSTRKPSVDVLQATQKPYTYELQLLSIP